MNCNYCGYFNQEQTSLCARCGSNFPEPSCTQCEAPVAWGEPLCDKCGVTSAAADEHPCPSCGALNSESAEYCTSCGSPMAVITRIVNLSRAREREPLETWRVYGIETKMVGRASEFELLQRMLDDATKNNQTRIVSIEASIGLGKSRLLAEFQRKLDASFSETVYLHTACRDEAGGAYSMFARLLKNRFYISEQDSTVAAARKFEEAVQALIEDPDEAQRISHLAGNLIGLTFANSPYLPDVRDSEGAFQLEDRCFEAVEDLLRADARNNPLVLVFEDLQYATNPSLNLIEHLAQYLVTSPILLVISWNPEELFSRRVIKDLPIDHAMSLRPLSDEEVDEFVRDTLVKAVEIPEELVQKIVVSAHGNPLSVEEMLRILISEGVIDTRHQEWVIHASRLKEVELPTTVRATVQARLESLTTDERDVLEMAACVGTFFWPELVRCLYHLQADQSESTPDYWGDNSVNERLDEVIESLERKDMVRRHGDSWAPGFEELHFKHRIERESIYDTVSSQRKQRYHRLIAQWVDHHCRDLEGAAEIIARHFDHARCLDQAARAYIEAADLARARYANRKAIELYSKGLSYVTDADIGLKLQAFHDIGSVYDLLGEYDQSLAYFREMLRYSWIVNDSSKGGVAHNKVGRAYRSLGEYAEARDHLQKALELFRADADVRGIASTLDDIGKIHWIRGEYEEALQYYSASLQLRRETGDRRSIALSLNHLGTLKLQRGELREAMVYFREALELRKAIDDRQGVADSFNNLGALCMERDDTKQAITLFMEALKMARAIGHRALEGIILNNLGEAHLSDGSLEEAKRVLDDAMQVAEDCGEKRILFDVLRNLGQTALKESNRQLALERINEALALATELNSMVLVGIGTQTLADAHAQHIFDPSLGEESALQADASYRKAVEILEEVGNESQLGRCLSSYGHFLLERGQIVQGKQKLELAGEIFKRLEMRKMWDATERIIEQI